MSSRLSPEHLDHLRGSGLNNETIELAALETEHDQLVVHRYLNLPPPKRWAKKSLGACLVFPCFEPGATEPYARRVRPDCPHVEKRDGKDRLRKYESPRGAGVLVYFPPRARSTGRFQAESTLLWTEGEKGGLLLDQCGYPCVALTGVWNAHDPRARNPPGRPRGSGPFVLHPRIVQYVRIADRDHIIVFDSDAREKPDVMLAATVLARMLFEAGARSVRLALPPSKPSGEKLGIDDYYVLVEQRGEQGAAAIAQLLSEASDVDLSYEARWAWKRDMIETEDGKPKKSVANVMNVMASHPAFEGVLARDEFRESIVKLRPPPVRAQDGVSTEGEWTEADSTRTAAWFASEIGFEPTSHQVLEAVCAIAERNRMHPVRDYLRSLEWDGTKRLDGVLADYFGAEDSKYSRAIGSRWMISAVARVMEPGCQVDCLLVLEGKQGARKSTALRALAGDDWFADTGIHIGDKDSYQALRAKWIYEFSELASVKGRERERVKLFISSRCDNYRPSYGRQNRGFPRQCVFAGTTNETEYLTDPTGERRYWPVRCGARIDVEALRRDRDQLWAEAVVRYQAGERWYVDTPELNALLEKEQSERKEEDPWTGLIEKWLAADPRRGVRGVTSEEVMAAALGLVAKDMGRGAATRVGHALRELGWTPKQQREQGERVRRYFPPAPAPAPADPPRPGRPNPSRPSAEAGWVNGTPRKQASEPPVTTVTTDSLQVHIEKRAEASPGDFQNFGEVGGTVVTVVTGGAGAAPGRYDVGTVVRGRREADALIAYLAAHPAELERLSSEVANDNGGPTARPQGDAVMAGDYARWYRAHPEALRRDARTAREAVS